MSYERKRDKQIFLSFNMISWEHIRGTYDKFPDFFSYGHLKLSKSLVKNSVCYCYTSYDMTDQFFMISGSNEQLQPELE